MTLKKAIGLRLFVLALAPASRPITPVARDWCYGNGGYILFEWDTYFAAAMLALPSFLENGTMSYENALISDEFASSLKSRKIEGRQP